MTIITVTAINVLLNNQDIEVDMIDVRMSTAALSKTMPPCRLFKKTVQQGRSECRPGGVPLGYVEDLNDARTKLAVFFDSLLRPIL
jgi:hypothetical protein